MGSWAPDEDGVFVLPSGLRVRGRGLRHGPPATPPDFTIVLLGRAPDPLPWPCRWVRWPDFRLPAVPADLRAALQEAQTRAAAERVEIACAGGRGRTGTALACLAVLDGVPAHEAVDYVRRNYHPKAVETPWQRRFVERFG